jgi:hypothetical protein
MMTTTNKRLLISESRDNSNRCTPYRGKPDQHDTYASQASPRIPSVRFLWAVPVRDNLSRVINSTSADRSAGSYPVSLPSQPLKQWRKSNIYHNRLLSLPSLYHQHAIGTFNTCSRGSTHLSLIDIGEGNNLGGAGLPRTVTPRVPNPHDYVNHMFKRS